MGRGGQNDRPALAMTVPPLPSALIRSLEVMPDASVGSSLRYRIELNEEHGAREPLDIWLRPTPWGTSLNGERTSAYERCRMVEECAHTLAGTVFGWHRQLVSEIVELDADAPARHRALWSVRRAGDLLLFEHAKTPEAHFLNITAGIAVEVLLPGWSGLCCLVVDGVCATCGPLGSRRCRMLLTRAPELARLPGIFTQPERVHDMAEELIQEGRASLVGVLPQIARLSRPGARIQLQLKLGDGGAWMLYDEVRDCCLTCELRTGPGCDHAEYAPLAAALRKLER